MSQDTVQLGINNSSDSLISAKEIILSLKNSGVKFGKSDPLRRLRYYVNLGLIPRPVKRLDPTKDYDKSKPPPTTSYYPSWVVEKLNSIEANKKSGISVQKQKAKIDHEESVKDIKNKFLSPSPPLAPIAIPSPHITSISPSIEISDLPIDKHVVSLASFPRLSFNKKAGNMLSGAIALTSIPALMVAGLILTSPMYLNTTTQFAADSFLKSGENLIADFGSNNSNKPTNIADKSFLGKAGSVLARTTSPYLKFNVDTEVAGLLNAFGGIFTNGEDANLGAGELTASNVLYDIIAGDNVTISTGQTPTISVPDAGAGVGSVTGTIGIITSTGGDNPIINIATNYTGQTSITTLGTIGTGTWNSTALTDAFVSDTLTVDGTGSVNAGAINSGTLGAAGVTLGLGSFGSVTGSLTDANVSDTLTIDGTGSITWTALTSYPATCGAGNFVRAIDDALTCAADSGGTGTLQDAYDNGNNITTSTARDIEFDLADTATDSDFIVDILGTGNIFEVRDGGSPIITVNDGGTVDLNSNLITNIGSTGTDFTSGGGLNIATDLDVAGHFALGASATPLSGHTLYLVDTLSDGSSRGITVEPTFDSSGVGATMHGVSVQPNCNPTSFVSSACYGVYTDIDVGGSDNLLEVAGFYVDTPSITGATVENLYGIYIRGQSGATNNYALFLADSSGTASTGITFATDVSLYRSAANVLRTGTGDDFTIGGNQLSITAAGAPLLSTIQFNNNDVFQYDDTSDFYTWTSDGVLEMTLDDNNGLTIANDLDIDGGDITTPADLTITPAGLDTNIIGRLNVNSTAIAGNPSILDLTDTNVADSGSWFYVISRCGSCFTPGAGSGDLILRSSQSDDDFAITTDAGITTSFKVTSTNRVGIAGINTPLDPLHILTDSGGDAIHIQEFSGGEDWQIGVDTTGDLNFENTGSIVIRFQDTNDVYFYGTSLTQSAFAIDDGADTVYVGDDLRIGQNTSTDDDTIYFDTSTTEYLRWDDSPGEFDFSDDLAVAGYVAVLGANGADDDSLYFDTGTTEFLRWDDVPGEFDLSDDLNVSLDITVGGNDINFGTGARINSGGARDIRLFGNSAVDSTFEWLGFYSGGTRQGIIIYDAAWAGCTNVATDFCLVAENGQRLALQSGTTEVYVNDGLRVNGELTVGTLGIDFANIDLITFDDSNAATVAGLSGIDSMWKFQGDGDTVIEIGTGDATPGIVLGSDVNLYRSAANELATSDNFDIASHLAIGGNAAVDSTQLLNLGESFTGAGTFHGANIFPRYTGTSAGVSLNGVEALASWQGGGGSSANNVRGLYSRPIQNTTTAITSLVGLEVLVSNDAIGGSGTITNGYGALFSSGYGGVVSITNSYGVRIQNHGAPGATVAYGLYIDDQTSTATNDYGLYIEGADTYALWIDSDTTRLDGATAFGAQATLSVDDTTPDVSTATSFITANTVATLISDFDAGAGSVEPGHLIFVEVNDANTDFDCTTSGLNCGTTDITTVAAGDFFTWYYDGTDWHLVSFMDDSDNQNAGSGFDIAEWFPASEELEPGDLVSIDPDSNTANSVMKSESDYDSKLIGIVSTNPGLTLGEPAEGFAYPVALTGRVPTKVSTENGDIQHGDPLTSSSAPGVAMKATKSGSIIGKALESYTKEETGVITVFISTGWYSAPLNISPIDGSTELIANTPILFGDNLISLDDSGRIKVDGDLLIAGNIEIDGDILLNGNLAAKEITTDQLFITDESSGNGNLQAGSSSSLINNANVSSASKISVTFNSNWSPASRYWVEKQNGNFVVRLDSPVTSDVSFDWFIIQGGR